ncbi:hypothetical protein HY572_04520 [Candidatus Micrarchaeota archaeon]|nr:hypothetical protein [Candidatus Micrarchaeota archaeon]
MSHIKRFLEYVKEKKPELHIGFRLMSDEGTVDYPQLEERLKRYIRDHGEKIEKLEGDPRESARMYVPQFRRELETFHEMFEYLGKHWEKAHHAGS